MRAGARRALPCAAPSPRKILQLQRATPLGPNTQTKRFAGIFEGFHIPRPTRKIAENMLPMSSAEGKFLKTPSKKADVSSPSRPQAGSHTAGEIVVRQTLRAFGR